MPAMEQDPSTSKPTVLWTTGDVAWGLVSAIGLVLALATLLYFIEYAIDPGLVVVFGTVLLLIPAWYFTIFKHNASWVDLGLRSFRGSTLGLGCGLMLASFLFNAIYGWILSLYGLQIQPDVAIIFDQTEFPILLLIGGAIIAPIVEELFFRGFIFAGLQQRWPWPIAGAVSALLFATVHIIPTSFLPIFILGFIFSYLYYRSGSIWPAILMHMLTNTIALSAAYALSKGWVPSV